jgi:hypothetical protein
LAAKSGFGGCDDLTTAVVAARDDSGDANTTGRVTRQKTTMSSATRKAATNDSDIECPLGGGNQMRALPAADLSQPTRRSSV